MRQYCISLSLILVIFLCAACTVNPVTGESEISLISPQQEVAMGEQNYLPSQQSQGGRYIVDPTLTDYVNRIGRSLAQRSDRQQSPYEFVVLNNDVPNAWALPGGKIAINRGLLMHLEDEAQLAAVLSHEIVHAAARHSARQITQNSLLGLGVAVLGGITADSDVGRMVTQGASIGAAAWQSRYSRENELEADDYGIQYMARAGYDPQAAIELQQIFVRLSEQRQTDFISGLFASHPPSRERVAANREHAKQLSLSGGARNKNEYQQAIGQLKQDAKAYELHQQAVAALAKQKNSDALTLVNQAINLQARENQFWETKARVQALDNNVSAAESSYSQAIALYPQYFRPYIGRALLYQQQQNFAAAEQDLLTSQQYLPTQITSFLLGQVSLSLGKNVQAIENYQRAAAAGGQLGQAASQELQKLGAQ